MKKVLKIILRVLLVLVILLAVGIGVLTVTEYRPEETETVIASHPAEAVFSTGKQMTLVSWNIGYGALGDNADFFMDGGKSVYTADRDRLQENMAGIVTTLQRIAGEAGSLDLAVLQEVDINSDRSYRTDERTQLKQVMPGGTEAFAYNFKSLYVPYPLPPIGHVESGLYTLSRADIRTAERVSLPCPFSWPVRTVNLKRCLLVSRIPLADTDRELVLINLHLEAYDDGAGKEAQTNKLMDILLEERDKGNYVIAAGDFNQQFSNVASPYKSDGAPWTPGVISADTFEENGFRIQMDPSAATCRSLDRALAGADPNDFYYYMIDGIIASENVQIDLIQTVDAGFRHTDHNPVRMTFTLLPPGEV